MTGGAVVSGLTNQALQLSPKHVEASGSIHDLKTKQDTRHTQDKP